MVQHQPLLMILISAPVSRNQRELLPDSLSGLAVKFPAFTNV